MKSFKEVYAASKAELLEARQNQITQEKDDILRGIKTELCITCKLKELNESKQQEVINMLYSFWSPKKGINKAGIAFLKEGKLAIDEKSSVANIKRFAQREIKDNINEFARAFAFNRGREVVERLQRNLETRTGKKFKYQPLFEMAFDIVSKKMADDNM